MKPSPGIWIVFTIMFFCFGAYHLVQLTSSVPRFAWNTYRPVIIESYSGTAVENRHNIDRFIGQWNKYVDHQNRNSRWLNIIAAATYFISAYMAFRSSNLNGIKDAVKYYRQHYAIAKKFIIHKRKMKNHVSDSKSVDSRHTQNPNE